MAESYSSRSRASVASGGTRTVITMFAVPCRLSITTSERVNMNIESGTLPARGGGVPTRSK